MRSVSTTSRWHLVKVPSPPQAPKGAPPKASARSSLPDRNPREKLTVTVSYRGGNEAWWELRARGQIWRIPGHVDLHAALWSLSRPSE